MSLQQEVPSHMFTLPRVWEQVRCCESAFTLKHALMWSFMFIGALSLPHKRLEPKM